MTGLSKLQRDTLDRMHPDGWTVACWTKPDVPVEPDYHHLGGTDDGISGFGGVHIVVNGAHVILSRRGRFIGYFAWGGRSIPKAGGRRPWTALVSEPSASGCLGDHRIPRAKHLVKGPVTHY